MFIFKNAEDLEQFISKMRNDNKQIGFIPTMGALHNGHISLINAAKQAKDITICSIFVNPTQFNNPDDLAKYPKTLDADIEKLTANNCDALFLPSIDDLYPNGTTQLEHYNLGIIETILEGAHRPGHFQGVCQVLNRFLEIVRPDRMYMGQKDFQQVAVVNILLNIIQSPTKLVIVPIKRDKDGLALSSRNMRLSAEEIILAKELHQSLLQIKDGFLNNNNFNKIKETELKRLESLGFVTDYLTLASEKDLTEMHSYDKGVKMVVLVAAALGPVRLIDNLLIN